MYKLKEGDKIPAFDSHDQDGKIVHSKDLLGKPFVLYFYPKDNTPGCTVEACSFRDQKVPFEKLECRVIGVSPDGQESHKKFIQDHGINFTLLADETKDLCKKFDVLRSTQDGQQKLERTTFLIDKHGHICWIERPVSVEGHSERIIAELHKI
jgi:thioredoxin-dependent peroxiredoxin